MPWLEIVTDAVRWWGAIAGVILVGIYIQSRLHHIRTGVWPEFKLKPWTLPMFAGSLGAFLVLMGGGIPFVRRVDWYTVDGLAFGLVALTGWYFVSVAGWLFVILKTTDLGLMRKVSWVTAAVMFAAAWASV